MQFILSGFTQEMGFRVFAFEGKGEDRLRTVCTVKADLALIRKYGIQIQDLPLLCRALLDQRDQGAEAQTLTFTEEQMRACAKDRQTARDEAASKKKPPRRPATDTSATAAPRVFGMAAGTDPHARDRVIPPGQGYQPVR